MSHAREVRHAVYMQRTSPNFAEFCVAHVTDPAHQFLFSHCNTPDRRLYLRLLDEARLADRGSALPDEGSADVAEAGLLFFSPRMTRDALDMPRFHDDDVDTLWGDLKELFGRSSLARAPRGSGSRGAAHSFAIGPHAPHLLPDKAALRGLLTALLRAAEDPHRSAADAAVSLMMRSLAQTEAVLYVCFSVCNRMLTFAERRWVAEVDEDEEEGEEGEERERALRETDRRGDKCRGAAGGADEGRDMCRSFVRYVEGATAILFLTARLLSVHRDREAVLRAAAEGDGVCLPRLRSQGSYVLYQAAFDRTLTGMVEAYLGCVQGLAEAESERHVASAGGAATPVVKAVGESVQFVLETVRVWRAEGALHAEGIENRMSCWEAKLAALLEHTT